MGFMISGRTQPINYYDKRCNRDRRQEGETYLLRLPKVPD